MGTADVPGCAPACQLSVGRNNGAASPHATSRIERVALHAAMLGAITVGHPESCRAKAASVS